MRRDLNGGGPSSCVRERWFLTAQDSVSCRSNGWKTDGRLQLGKDKVWQGSDGCPQRMEDDKVKNLGVWFKRRKKQHF